MWGSGPGVAREDRSPAGHRDDRDRKGGAGAGEPGDRQGRDRVVPGESRFVRTEDRRTEEQEAEEIVSTALCTMHDSASSLSTRCELERAPEMPSCTFF